ncbi:MULTISPECIES: mannose-6-phosphate isomerase, class I [Pasteurellaceae]|uniref:Mannose-6-phosphate isomerase n=1 Tax=Pasteurella atlantica TaxID=2827233 RepID=A0AAW8CNG2_9PAST|nr:mannose-6-phosphate isomerase, class I [Pasteurella atlantica]MBR0573032.1 mannose-6-phosphate isomerase, class I [Pasteurella atlantica]MDP8038841.1 mannose-6-phosphate isomerase, class I [Pasteurella atlantica]MDP8041050.1 mannose-6-phosphate isomerase, class I [Pasteurella atlantica]MDP8043186.1 mannose-6-phosphate isomerase, class I [Pasteurella atlantica]MDP8045272.1 mannose-6-phosphate isomerase, class I [Pasteurella atlantica]
MSDLLFKLNNVIQNYAWGSKTSLNQLFDIPNPDNKPQAELWMGAHPNGCSKNAETGELLSTLINQNIANFLGNRTASQFGELPFLFKVLCAEEPLSIQVHPNKKKAELGFAKENEKGIDLKAPNRNYKDPNHKPELVYALTPYKAMNGFRPIEQIISLFKEANLLSLKKEISALKQSQNSEGLKRFFSAIMSLNNEQKDQILTELYTQLEKGAKTKLGKEAFDYIQHFRQYYDNDIGLLSPLMLNTIELQPNEAMFLYAETPHAYVQGTGLEIMANSDNVLRAGLTPKYIDVAELIDNTKFDSISPENIKIEPNNNNEYPIPVPDFKFAIMTVTENVKTHSLNSAEILFCTKGEIIIHSHNKQIILHKGESAFIGYGLESYQYSGKGLIARAYV